MIKSLLFSVVIVQFSCAVQHTKNFEKNGEGLYDDWWQNAVLYQIYPRSFKDSNGDGNGDIKGIVQKLDYLSDIGVDGIWMSPIYKSPQVDNGYDISDYRDIDELYGTLEDLRLLVDEAHKRNIKVIMDYVPNHTSDKHEWFQKSIENIAPYSDYYIWKNATFVDGERKPPNNWISSFWGSAWEWNEERQQYYYHQFATAQPDLNYRNSDLVEEMKNVLRYWMDFGIDGFRMDAIPMLVEDELFRDEPSSGAEGLDPNDPGNLNHIYTFNQNETYDMIYQWREVLDEYTEQKSSITKMMVTEVYADPELTMLYYRSADGRTGAHFTFNFISFVMYTPKDFTALNLVDTMWTWFINIPEGCSSNWVLGNHDQTRVATRLGVENIDALNILSGILPGVKITYQGEEIGQENGEVTCQQGYDPQAIKNCTTYNTTSRDFERTPFQWDTSKNAGFSDADETWLPVSEKYLDTNFEKQNVSGAVTHYNIFKTLVEIRSNFKNTTYDSVSLSTYENDTVLYVERRTDNGHYIFLFNVNDVEEKTVPKSVFLDIYSVSVALTGINSQYKIGDAFNTSWPLKPRESVLLQLSLIE